MRSVALALVILCVCLASASRFHPEIKLGGPTPGKTPVKYSYNDGVTQIHYEVVHSAVFLLDAEDHITAVSCKGTEMQIKTSPNFQLVIPKNTTLVGSAPWKCADENGQTGFPFYRTLVSLSAPVKSGSEFVYTAQTTFAGVADCFDDGSFLNLTSTAMNTPYSANRTARAVVDRNFGFNYDSSSGKAKDNIALFSADGVKLDCTNCFVDFELGMSVGVTFGRKDIIIPYLKGFHADVSGTAKNSIQLQLSAAAAKSESASKVIATIPLPGFTFFIGFVPVHITLSIPITIGYTVTAAASVALTYGYDAEGSVQLGADYSGGKWQPVSSRTFAAHVHEPALTKKASAAAEAFIESSINMEFYSVGGAQFNLKRDFSAAVATPGCTGAQLHVSANSAVTGSVDAILTKPVHLTSPAWTVFSDQTPLESKCL